MSLGFEPGHVSKPLLGFNILIFTDTADEFKYLPSLSLSLMALDHLENRTADADIGKKTETSLTEVVSDIFGGTVVFGTEFRTVISRLQGFFAGSR